jgi:hypothetical protein
MRAGRWIAKRAHHGEFDSGRDDVFPATGLVVGFCPRKTEHVGKESFGEAMASNDGFGERMSIRQQTNDATVDFNEAGPLHSANHFRNGRPREFKAISDARLDHVDVVFSQFKDGLAIFFESGMPFTLFAGGHDQSLRRVWPKATGR